ncbi:hypothetical protein [Gracilibacillus phocaeensis]|uniref:hypothetical protein n=1 Tax=Gracilibacillus phocaeensis TaxID=2042304 RepID=UPI001030DAC4|nr:hypothetical protein [Gracilibacillus phocaeensis]
MDVLRKYWLPVLIYLLTFLIVPYFMMEQVEDGLALAIIDLFLLNSIAVFLGVCYITYKYGFDWVNLLIIALLYLLSCYTIWNESALVYFVLYGIVAGVGLLVGYLFRKKLRSRPQ